MEFFNALVHFNPVALIQAGGYIGIALIIFSESGFLFGIFLPGDSLLFTAGILASGGILTLSSIMIWAAVAAILGYALGYWFGEKTGDALFKKPDSRFFKQKWVESTKVFYKEYGGRTVLLARFIPFVRTIAPVLAGTIFMKYRTFLFYNIIGGIIWGIGMPLLGFLFGSMLPRGAEYIVLISFVIIVISFLPILIKIISKKHRTLIEKSASRQSE